MTTTREVDVLVLGSGFGAMAPALRLAQAGLRVLILEKGPHVDTSTFRMTQDPAYLTRYLKGIAGPGINLTFAEALGGGSGFYEMVSLRAPRIAFDQAGPDGRPLWPEGLDRPALDPFYDQAERMLRVAQIEEDRIPRSGLVFARLLRNLGYSCDRARYAVQDCLGSGYCVSGCVFGRKQSLHLNYIPQALGSGAEIACGMEAVRIDMMSGGPRPSYAVTARERDGGGLTTFRAPIVVLGGGTVGTAALLLGSRHGLPRLSRAVGQHIAFNGGARMAALLPAGIPDGDMYSGQSHPGMISYEFLGTHGLTVSAVKPLPLQVIASARLTRAGQAEDWWGDAHVALMRRLRTRGIVLITLGLTPPAGRLSIGAGGRPQVSLRWTPALRAHKQAARQLLSDILERNGCEVLDTRFVDGSGQPHRGDHVSTAHQVGSARMADRPADGVCDRWGEVFGYPGLFVTDGAAIPSSLAVNTSLTILANAERIAAEMVRRFGRGA